MAMMWDLVAELNSANAGLGEQPWLYTGDGNILEGGTAIRVNRMFCYAEVVECTDLAGAFGQADCVMIDTKSVDFPRGVKGRKRIREALEAGGLERSVRDLARAYSGDMRWKRWAAIAAALHSWGLSDSNRTTVLRYGDDESADDDEIMGQGRMEVDQTVDGREGVEAEFLEALT